MYRLESNKHAVLGDSFVFLCSLTFISSFAETNTYEYIHTLARTARPPCGAGQAVRRALCYHSMLRGISGLFADFSRSLLKSVVAKETTARTRSDER